MCILLMNQAQRLQQKSSMLWAQVLKAKYFPHTNLYDSGINPRASHIWKALLVGIRWLQRGMNWVLGDGQNIHVWRITRYLEGRYEVIFKALFCLMKNKGQLVPYGIIIFGGQKIYNFPSQHILNNLYKAFLQPNWLDYRIPLYGLRITVFVRSDLHRNFYTNNLMFLLQKPIGIGIGIGNYNVPKKTNFLFGNPYETICLPVYICHFLARK